MEEAFDKDEFHSKVSEKVSDINEAFSEILEIFNDNIEFVITSEDIQFAGGGIHGIMDLFDQFNNRLGKLDFKFQRKYGDIKTHDERQLRFEKMVLDSLDNIPITDAHDER